MSLEIMSYANAFSNTTAIRSPSDISGSTAIRFDEVDLTPTTAVIHVEGYAMNTMQDHNNQSHSSRVLCIPFHCNAGVSRTTAARDGRCGRDVYLSRRVDINHSQGQKRWTRATSGQEIIVESLNGIV